MDNVRSPRAPSKSGYLTGLAFALILTSIPFGVVAFDLLRPLPAALVIAIAALVQVVVHFRYFLHVEFVSALRDRNLALVFTAILILIMVGGSLWIMLNLHHRMM